MEGTLAERVTVAWESLGPAERRVAEFVAGHGAEVVMLSAMAIASQAGVSDATVVRTARRLGFDGLGALRAAAFDESHRAPTQSDRLASTLDLTVDDPSQAWPLAVQDAAGDLMEAAHRIPPELFGRAVEALRAASRLVVVGVGPSGHLADYARTSWRRVGCDVRAVTSTGLQLADDLLDLRAEDVVVLLAYSQLQDHTRGVLDAAAAVGAPIVLVTDVLGELLRDQVAVVLPAGQGPPGRVASHVATIAVLEAMGVALAVLDRDRAAATLDRLNHLRRSITGRPNEVDRPHPAC